MKGSCNFGNFGDNTFEDNLCNFPIFFFMANAYDQQKESIYIQSPQFNNNQIKFIYVSNN